MTHDLLITNARVVLAHETLRQATVQLRDGLIQAVHHGTSNLPGAVDLHGDWLIPGLVELHTDNLERHVTPRPRTALPMSSAVPAHDAEIAAAGITTVFDAIGVGDPYGDGFRARDQGMLLGVLDQLEAAGLLRSQHLIHVRCELPADNALELFEPFATHRRLRLISLMDHTPGQRQWEDLRQARIYYTGKRGWSDEKFDRQVALAPELQRHHAVPHREYFVAYANSHEIVLASHDDTTLAHVEEAAQSGATISEFPTTVAAARAACAKGLSVVMGAPNVVRGGSHSGNVAAAQLARLGLLDVLSSDYVPSSLLLSAFMLVDLAGFTVPRAIATISRNPALAVGLADRGEIAVGRRADLVQVRLVAEGSHAPQPHVVGVWRAGARVI